MLFRLFPRLTVAALVFLEDNFWACYGIVLSPYIPQKLCFWIRSEFIASSVKYIYISLFPSLSLSALLFICIYSIVEFSREVNFFPSHLNSIVFEVILKFLTLNSSFISYLFISTPSFTLSSLFLSLDQLKIWQQTATDRNLIALLRQVSFSATTTSRDCHVTFSGAPALIEHRNLKFLIINNPTPATLPKFINVSIIISTNITKNRVHSIFRNTLLV